MANLRQIIATTVRRQCVIDLIELGVKSRHPAWTCVDDMGEVYYCYFLTLTLTLTLNLTLALTLIIMEWLWKSIRVSQFLCKRVIAIRRTFVPP